MMKYKLSDIALITGGKLTGENRLVNGVLTDSRSGATVSAPAFVALSGQYRDGHDYIAKLYDRGVRAFVVSREMNTEEYPDAGFVVVENTLAALQQWAAYHRAQFAGKVIGITGSNGKTIIKEWIAQLAPAGITLFRSPRSYNSQIGVALSLLMLNGEDVAVIEAGISQPGEMEKLEAMIRPEIGILTNIGSAHQEYFSGEDQKRREKALLFKHSDTILYPENQSEIIRQYPGKKGIEIGKEYDRFIPFTDKVSIENARTALFTWLALGIPFGDIQEKLNKLQPVAMRMELKEGIGGSKIINDSYNADVNSLSAALDSLESIAGEEEKVLILSDIFQSGLSNRELYTEVARLVENAGISRLIGIGENISSCGDLFSGDNTFYSSTKEFIQNLHRNEFHNKAILIKGSRSFAFEEISRILEKQVHTTVLEVDLNAMIHNLNHYRSKLRPGTKIMAMVKALSYGSGSFEVASTLQHQGVDYLAVAFADEGVVLREAGIPLPIVVLNADSDSFGTMIDYRLEPEIYSFTSLAEFTDTLKRKGEQAYPIHLNFDTGMHRLGFTEEELETLIRTLKATHEVFVKSAFTHFAASDEPAENDFTLRQFEQFKQIGKRLQTAFPNRNILLHTANSAAIERFPDAQLDMVRLGIGLYGISAFEEGLQPVGTLKSRIVQIKTLKPGDTVGYGRHGKITRNSTIATVPIGYADGLDRRLGKGAWCFEVNGKPAPTIGNICMDTCMIDITGIHAREGDTVIVFGKNYTAKKMADKLNTIPYEILTSISTRVKRVFSKE